MKVESKTESRFITKNREKSIKRQISQKLILNIEIELSNNNGGYYQWVTFSIVCLMLCVFITLSVELIEHLVVVQIVFI